MVAITLPDGTERRYDGPVTGADVASDIGPGLAKAALAIVVNGELRDLARQIDEDAAVEIVTKSRIEPGESGRGHQIWWATFVGSSVLDRIIAQWDPIELDSWINRESLAIFSKPRLKLFVFTID